MKRLNALAAVLVLMIVSITFAGCGKKPEKPAGFSTLAEYRAELAKVCSFHGKTFDNQTQTISVNTISTQSADLPNIKLIIDYADFGNYNTYTWADEMVYWLFESDEGERDQTYLVDYNKTEETVKRFISDDEINWNMDVVETSNESIGMWKAPQILYNELNPIYYALNEEKSTDAKQVFDFIADDSTFMFKNKSLYITKDGLFLDGELETGEAFSSSIVIGGQTIVPPFEILSSL